MKKLILVCLPVIALLLALPSRASAGHGCCSCPAPCGAWYLSWPCGADMGSPAVPTYPYWPTQTAPATAGQAYAPSYGYGYTYPANAANFNPNPGYQQVGFYGQAPSYWYSR